MGVQVHRFVPAESSATWSRPCCGACSRKTHSARAGCYSTRPRGGRDRLRSACASSIGGGYNGSSIVARDGRGKRHPLGRLSLEQRSSTSGPVCRLWACISWRIGSTTRGPLTSLWPSWSCTSPLRIIVSPRKPGKMPPDHPIVRGLFAMIPHQFYYQLVVLGLLWLFVMLHL